MNLPDLLHLMKLLAPPFYLLGVICFYRLMRRDYIAEHGTWTQKDRLETIALSLLSWPGAIVGCLAEVAGILGSEKKAKW